jgi:CelD/BcsL family acetyltransferase involved in cellulose biosynthesis
VVEGGESVRAQKSFHNLERVLMESQSTLLEKTPVRPDVPPQIRLDVARSADEFDALHEEWESLLAESDARIFQTWEWQRTWWKYFGEGDSQKQLYVLQFREGETLIGIAPLFIEKINAVWPLTYRQVAFLGRGTSDYLDIIALRGRENDVLGELAAHLGHARKEFDVVLLEDIRDTSPTHEVLSAALQRWGYGGGKFQSDTCPRISLQSTWEATRKSFPSAQRYRLGRCWRKMNDELHTTYERVLGEDEVDAAMGDFIRIHQERWQSVGHRGVFADGPTENFHREVAPLLHQRGHLFLVFLRLGGKRVVADYGYEYRGEFCTYLSGVLGDHEFLRFSPGRVLLMHVMEECSLKGVGVFDFMRGNEPFKYTFGAVDVPNWTILCYGGAPKSAAALHRFFLLRRSLTRRAAHEWLHLQTQRRKFGLFSQEFRSYLLKRPGLVIGDGMKKARAPEKSISLDEKEEAS